MATAPKPKGIGAGIKSLPKPALIGIPVAGALACYLYQRRKNNTAATTAANAAATPAVDTGAVTTGTADTGGGSGAIAQGQDFSSQIQALQGQASTEITDLDAIKSQQTQLLSTEEKDLSVDNKNLATSTKDLASDTADYSVDRQDLLTDNSGIAAPVKMGGSTSAPKKPVTPAAKLPKPMATPKVTPAKIAPTKKTTYTAPRPAATATGGRANSSRGPIPLKAPAKKK
jgi:hypothetical protein